MASTMDFSRLDARAALDLAIMIEEDAQLRYEALARLVGGDPGGAGEVFREMAVNERKHRADLEARRGALCQADPRIEISLMEGGVERPDADDHDLPRTAREALGIALAAEKRAHAFYLEALPGLSDGGARALFEDLAQEEAEHVVRLERKLAALGAAPSLALRVTPRAALPAAALAFPDRSALEAVLPLFDAATQAVAVGVIVEGRDPGDVAASLGVSPRSVAWKLKRFLDLARQQLAVAMAAAALTGCAGAELPGNAAHRAAQAWPQDARAAVIDQVTRAQAPQEPADVGARAEAAAAKEASDLEFTEGLAEPPQ
jgi:erythrin-vacuolar iron transport family protein